DARATVKCESRPSLARPANTIGSPIESDSMRWRYVILGVLCCVPVATAIQGWPPRPGFSVVGFGYYLRDERSTNRILFVQMLGKQPLQAPVVTRYDADTGELVSSTTLAWPGGVEKRVGLREPKLSEDGSVIRFRGVQQGPGGFATTTTGTQLYDTWTGA